ncbi:hypothetical protein PWT90_03802 [Aphanocladium album]|nr:hypothetical protein PWT90_03802 [Aphanocladium album]
MFFSQFENATFLPYASLAALLSVTAEASMTGTSTHGANQSLASLKLPAQAQTIDSAKFASLPSVAPPSEYDGRTIWVPPGVTRQQLKDRPFHVYDSEFLDIIGHEPKLTIIAESDKDPLFHEAVVWVPPTDEVFFVQNAGPPDAGTGLNKSAIVQKISVKEALQIASGNKTGHVQVHTVKSNPPVINPNGGTNYKGNILFAGEGMGNKTAPALYAVNPRSPYNSTILINNYYGRQFNSLNDIGINPRNSHIYFTDPLYGYFQSFRPAPVLPVQVYRLNPETMAVTVAASEFDQVNGITFSPDGNVVYVTDTGANHGFFRYDAARPATMKTFAFADNGVPDGIHCDSKGNVYAGCGDGVHVWNPSGKLLGKIFTDGTAANFQFAGDGKMVICAETRLFQDADVYSTLTPLLRTEATEVQTGLGRVTLTNIIIACIICREYRKMRVNVRLGIRCASGISKTLNHAARTRPWRGCLGVIFAPSGCGQPPIRRGYNTNIPASDNSQPTCNNVLERAVRLSMAPLNGNVKMLCTRCEKGGVATTMTLSKADVATEYGLSPRDLQIIDLPSQGFPHVLVRESTILFHIFDLRLLIQADKILLFHIDGLADKTISRVFTYDLQNKLQGGHVLHKKMNESFELLTLEAALASVAAGLEAEYLFAKKDVNEALRQLDEQMADKEEESVHTALRKLLDMARRLADIEQRARLVRNALQEFLAEDQDMADLYLTDKKNGNRHSIEDHEEVEYLFEAYFRANDSVVQEASALMANVHRTDDTIRSILANRRNQIMILETKVEIAMLSMAVATLVAGWYGMNTVNFLEESVYAFGVIVSGSLVGGGAIWMFLLRRLRNIRRTKL